jgi:hypothetical protein
LQPGRVAVRAEIEPASNSDATDNLRCSCVICHQCRAARALQSWGPEWLELTFVDADLQQVFDRWAFLAEPIRKAVMALVQP